MNATREHTGRVRELHDRLLSGSRLHRRTVEVDGRRVNVLGCGRGEPVVLLHGTNGSALFLLPLLERLDAVRVIAPDRPGHGLSDPADLPPGRHREAATVWLDHLLDALELDSAALVGHSAGGVWALWSALARPDRVTGLGVIGPPLLPGTCAPLPYRLVATPGIGRLLQRIPPTPGSVRGFARLMGEADSVGGLPDTVETMVAAGRDPVARAADLCEAREIVSAFALLSPSGFRRRARIRPGELAGLAVPTLVMWGEHDPLGGVEEARALTGMIPDGRLEVLTGGHAPFLGDPGRSAALITAFVRTRRRIP